MKGKITLAEDSSNFEENVEVKVRFTLDSWKTYEDIFCVHLKDENQANKKMGKFGFELNIPKGVSLEFAICCRDAINGWEKWDNFNEKNYKFTDLESSS